VTFKQWASFIALTLIWGASFLWIKIAVQETGPITVVAIRLVFALLMLLPFLLRARVLFPRSVRQLRQLLTLGLISATVPWLLITWA
jgi:drug/metabolite transporter (DMT)-like permease